MHTNQFTTISSRYLVTSYGNGWAYNIADQETGAEFFVQDESAAIVQFQTDDFENEDAIANYFDLMEEAEQ